MAATSAIPKSKVSGGSFLLEERKPSEIFTPEDFSEQHQLIAQTAEDFAVNEIIPNAEKIEHKDFSITRDLLKKAGELGLSSPAFFSRSRVIEKSLCSIFSALGMISFTAKSSAVWAMSWCCSEKSSGVKISLGFRSSSRKLPPETLLLGIAEVAAM